MSVGITFGAWDLCHPGHLHFIKACAMECDDLIIGLHVDPTVERPEFKEKPVESVFERFWRLQALDCVAQIVPYETESDLRDMLAMIQPLDYYFLGSDYRDKQLDPRVHDILSELDIGIIYIPRLHSFSSTDLRKRIRAKK